jgi:hypothetical protein
LSQIVVPKEQRGQGVGSRKMKELTDFADKYRMRILLTPTKDYGASSVQRLQDFYSGFGFVSNKGKNKDHTTQEAMIRNPVLVARERSVSAATDILSKLVQTMKSRAFAAVLEECPMCCGPTDGGCLVVAKALQMALDGGTIVRIVSTHDDESELTEHYGLEIGSGKIIDGDGVFPDAHSWLNAFSVETRILPTKLRIERGVSDSPEDDTYDDPTTVKNLTKILQRGMGYR